MRWYAGGMHPLGWVMMILFWIALIALIVWLVMRLIPAGGSRRDVAAGPPAPPQVLPPGAPAPESPLDILDRRFARGELDLETYRAQRSALIEARGGER